ncbi:SRPBCC family protein [Intrasporangium sp.]|uniref:SRPBCC family protein n=1 Tax=Intrasporangium sp. TaxID=1925024 RepID=UPI00293A9E30|nr:SRPBCC family protein [Intrasporangium sp.]MDV3222216.1 SRPBCC family protein [Intrasporangium sp.]
MQFVRTVTVPVPADRVFAYLADFTTTTEWDPASVTTERVSGDGGVGTRYRNVSSFMGREAEVMYVVTELEPGRRLVLRGENSTLVALDEMTVEGDSTRATVTYSATFELKGLRKIAAFALAPALRRLVDNGADGLRRTLAGLAV